MPKAKPTQSDISNISDQVSRALDYVSDLQVLIKSKSSGDLESAFRSSKTDMGEGRSIEELNEKLSATGLPTKFDGQLLLLLSYCFYNIGYELTEGISEKVSIKLHKSFFAGYEIKCKKMQKAIDKMLLKYDIDEAIKLLKEVEGDGGYGSMIVAKKDPGLLVAKYSNNWLDGMQRTLEMMGSADGVSQRFEIFG